jgi:hypothetical protein
VFYKLDILFLSLCIEKVVVVYFKVMLPHLPPMKHEIRVRIVCLGGRRLKPVNSYCLSLELFVPKEFHVTGTVNMIWLLSPLMGPAATWHYCVQHMTDHR